MHTKKNRLLAILFYFESFPPEDGQATCWRDACIRLPAQAGSFGSRFNHGFQISQNYLLFSDRFHLILRD